MEYDHAKRRLPFLGQMSIGINFGGGSFYFSCRRNCQRIFWKIASEQNKILLRPSRSEETVGFCCETGAEEAKPRRLLHDNGHRSLANQQLNKIRAKYSKKKVFRKKKFYLEHELFSHTRQSHVEPQMAQ